MLAGVAALILEFDGRGLEDPEEEADDVGVLDEGGCVPVEFEGGLAGGAGCGVESDVEDVGGREASFHERVMMGRPRRREEVAMAVPGDAVFVGEFGGVGVGLGGGGGEVESDGGEFCGGANSEAGRRRVCENSEKPWPEVGGWRKEVRVRSAGNWGTSWTAGVGGVMGGGVGG